MDAALKPEIVVPLQILSDRSVCQITCRKDMRNATTILARGASVLGQMQFQKTPVRAGETVERVQRLAHPRTFGPATADPGGQRHHGDLPGGDRLLTGLDVRFAAPASDILDMAGGDVANRCTGRQTVLGQSDSSVLQIGANLFVLLRIESDSVQQVVQ